jgi:hypothetical protein
MVSAFPAMHPESSHPLQRVARVGSQGLRCHRNVTPILQVSDTRWHHESLGFLGLPSCSWGDMFKPILQGTGPEVSHCRVIVSQEESI